MAQKINSTAALNTILEQAVSDLNLTHEEVNDIISTAYHPDSGMTDVSNYSLIKNTFVNYEQMLKMNPGSSLKYEKSQDELMMKYFLGNLYSSIDSFKMALTQAGIIDNFEYRPVHQSVTLNSVTRSQENRNVITLDINLDDINHMIEIDLAKKFEDFMMEHHQKNETTLSLINDTLGLCAKMYLANDLSTEEISILNDLNKWMRPENYIVSRQDPYFIYGVDNQLVVRSDLLPESAKIDSQSGLEIYSDHSMQIEDIKAQVEDVKSILGSSVFDFLSEQGLRFDFCDFDSRFQVDENTYNMNYLSNHVAAFYDPTKKAIAINTSIVNKNNSIVTLIHEIGHFINFLIQEKSKTLSLYDANYGHYHTILGAQNEWFYQNKLLGKWSETFVSEYSGSNPLENFAEVFTLYMLQRANRMDLLDLDFAHHSEAVQSLDLVDPMGFLLMNKIMTTLENRKAEVESYNLLMENGIDRNLINNTLLYMISSSGQLQIKSQMSEKANQRRFPLGVEFKKKWQTISLQMLYATPSDPDSMIFYSETEDFLNSLLNNENYKNPEVREYFRANEAGLSLTDGICIDFYDFRVVRLIVRIHATEDRQEQARILVREGLYDEEQLASFLQNLTMIDPAVVEPLLNPNDLISEAYLEYQSQLRDYGVEE